MSSFHKPKLYRTLDGCCICKAKSSSSRWWLESRDWRLLLTLSPSLRFTSSAKYEENFRKCFHLSEPRRGEICNACVLLVKRFKKLPVSSGRHWGHVVDARAGPGVKNFVRERRRESCRERSFKKKHVYRRKPASSETESDAEPAAVSQKTPGSCGCSVMRTLSTKLMYFQFPYPNLSRASQECRILLISLYLRSKSLHYWSALAGIRSPNLFTI